MANLSQANVDRFTGVATTYDAYRPAAPPIVAEIITRVSGNPRPERVVDLACGTGLSTRLWANRAGQVIGVEPNVDMRRQAEDATADPNIRYVSGTGPETGLPDSFADVVTVSQAMHWLEPESTLAEVARILRPGGLFAIYDYDWPPVMGWEIEQARAAFLQRVEELRLDRSGHIPLVRWGKSGHLERMRASGHFRYTREILAHHVDQGNAERLIGQVLSLSHVTRLLQSGVSEAEIGLDTLRAAADRLLGPELSPWYWSYRIRIGITT